jgi:uncharacterized membrane protein
MPQDSRIPFLQIGQSDNILRAWILVATILFVFVSPPFDVNDEPQHFSRAYQISLGHFIAGPGRGQMGELTMGAVLPQSIIDLSNKDFPRTQTFVRRKYSLEDIKAGWGRSLDSARQKFAEFANVASYAPTLYAPQAFGIIIGRFLDLPPLGLFYLARLVNGLTGILLVIASTLIAPFGKRVFLVFASLPTLIIQTASVSPDATIYGVSFLATALSLRCASRVPRMRESLCMMMLAALLGLAKVIYLPVILAGLGWQPWRIRGAWLAIVSVFVGALAFLVWWYWSKGTQIPFAVVSIKTHQLEMTAPMDAQLHVILTHPFAYLGVLLKSFLTRFPVYVLQIVGRPGWNAFLMPLAVYLLAGLMMASALIEGPGAQGMPALDERIWWLALAGAGVVLIETALYLTGTPLGADYIEGTQGRYFPPFLALAGLALRVPSRHVWSRRLQAAFVPGCALLILFGLATCIYAFWISGYVEYEGFPPFNATLPGLLRTLILPSGSWTPA